MAEDKKPHPVTLKALQSLVRAIILLYPTKCREWEEGWEEEKGEMEEELLKIESDLTHEE